MVALAQSTQLGMPGIANPQQSATFQASKDTKKIGVDEAFPDRSVIIGAGLENK